MTEQQWAVRISNRRGETGHPNYIGPLTRLQAEQLMDRLSAARRSYEGAPLLSEAELPGLWSTPPTPAAAD